jgi:ABC-type branched-subunit amino acid transport system ATPase component
MDHRAEFSAATRKIIAERAGYQCSVLNCGRLTVGPGPGQAQVVSIGMAAHIYAASPSGPRGTGGLSAAERSEPENGIWCCYSHGKAIDSNIGNAFSVAQLKAWKRLHEARKSAEMTGAPQDRFGLVESISVNSAPAPFSGRKFELGMRNIITGPNASGKTVLTRLIASVAYPDHVAEMSRYRNVDIEVRWFDPYTHDVATTGRSGNVTHVLDGRPVPYVARPYKTILINDGWRNSLGSLVVLSQMFDLSSSAMKGTLRMLAESSELVKEINFHDTYIDWVLDINGRTVRSTGAQEVSGSMESLILLELAGVHACHHARVEPTFLLVDELFGFHPREEIAALERLQTAAEHAQIAVISHSPAVVEEMSREWTLTALEYHRPSDIHVLGCPIDFEIETTTAPPTAFDPK